MTPRARPFLALVVAVAAAGAALAACAGHPTRTSQQQTARDEILMLHGRILDWRREAGLDPAPAARLVRLYFGSPEKPVPQSAEPVPELCRDTCNLSDYICQAADDICRIAGKLPGDEWAEDKCASAKASCSEARRKCTDCATRAKRSESQ